MTPLLLFSCSLNLSICFHHHHLSLTHFLLHYKSPEIDEPYRTGVVPCVSSYNTSVNQVSKPNGTWRFTQYLCRIHKIIILLAYFLLDVQSIISSILCPHSHFTVIDLCSIFFSVPVEEQTQPLFAFTIRGYQYT